MVQSCVLGQFYGDLANEAFLTNFAVYHRRFSTNTVTRPNHTPPRPTTRPTTRLSHAPTTPHHRAPHRALCAPRFTLRVYVHILCEMRACAKACARAVRTPQ